MSVFGLRWCAWSRSGVGGVGRECVGAWIRAWRGGVMSV